MFLSTFIATEQFQRLVNCIFWRNICFWLREMQPQNVVLIIDITVPLSWVPYFRREMLLKTVFSQTLTFQLPSVFVTVCTQNVSLWRFALSRAERTNLSQQLPSFYRWRFINFPVQAHCPSFDDSRELSPVISSSAPSPQ